MRGKQYKVALTQAERRLLSAITKKGNHPARQITRANILLFLDQKPEGKKETVLTDAEIAEKCHYETKLAYTVSQHYTEQGLDRVLTRKNCKSIFSSRFLPVFGMTIPSRPKQPSKQSCLYGSLAPSVQSTTFSL
jgi:hypothetical protein